jgi:TatD DNase family protein
MIDTHCHLFDAAFDADRREVVSRSREAGVTQLLMPNVDSGTYPAMMRTAAEFPSLCRPMIGVHPTSIDDKNVESELAFVRSKLEENPPATFVAIGEIGIDCYWSRAHLQQQLAAFAQQLQLAEQHELPVVIHARSSFDEILEVLRRDKPRVRGVFHAFSGSVALYHDIKKLGDYKLGIGGVITFKNSGLAETVKEVPLSDLLLETDAPYLTPAPFRGKRNESCHLQLVAQKIAEVKGLSLEEVVKATGDNATQLFGIA